MARKSSPTTARCPLILYPRNLSSSKPCTDCPCFLYGLQSERCGRDGGEHIQCQPAESWAVLPQGSLDASRPLHSLRDKSVTSIVASSAQIQCFCFEEQRLRPHEEIDMPVSVWGLREGAVERCG